MHKAPVDIVIVGGGIAGVSTAYFLSTSSHRPPHSRIILVEGTGIAAAASGYSGGFLARDWHGSDTASLAAMSYDLHAKLASQFDGPRRWGYRPVDTLSVTIDATRKQSKSPSIKQSPVPWLLEGSVHKYSSLGTPSSTAQVHPRLLTQFLADSFLREPNTEIVLGTATALEFGRAAGSGPVNSVTIDVNDGGGLRVIDADAVVLAAGPWLGRLAQSLLPPSIARGLNVTGHLAHAIVLKTSELLTPHCLFTDLTLADGSMSEPEVYPRPDGTTLICGASVEEPLPSTAAKVVPRPESIQQLHAQASGVSPVFTTEGGSSTVAETACFLPIAGRGRPLVGKVRGVDGVYVGGGLSCWGITQGPGTGLVLSELILEGKVKSADVSKLAP